MCIYLVLKFPWLRTICRTHSSRKLRLSRMLIDCSSCVSILLFYNYARQEKRLHVRQALLIYNNAKLSVISIVVTHSALKPQSTFASVISADQERKGQKEQNRSFTGVRNIMAVK